MDTLGIPGTIVHTGYVCAYVTHLPARLLALPASTPALDPALAPGCYCFGHSLGGALALLAEAAHPGTFAAIYAYEPAVATQTWSRKLNGR